ncbi:SpoIIE family protein phosphatase [Streptomyces sp. NPDC101115]|uniref:SpoIIE family protein phosphatase n=1 Tax=Streptomyces sp. NPDC101115 TaxID=3366106 RepID=UPI00380D04A7
MNSERHLAASAPPVPPRATTRLSGSRPSASRWTAVHGPDETEPDGGCGATDVGGATVGAITLASAGHPLPLIISPDGGRTPVPAHPGRPLGIRRPPFEATEPELSEGSLLVSSGYGGSRCPHSTKAGLGTVTLSPAGPAGPPGARRRRPWRPDRHVHGVRPHRGTVAGWCYGIRGPSPWSGMGRRTPAWRADSWAMMPGRV